MATNADLKIQKLKERAEYLAIVEQEKEEARQKKEHDKKIKEEIRLKKEHDKQIKDEARLKKLKEVEEIKIQKQKEQAELKLKEMNDLLEFRQKVIEEKENERKLKVAQRVQEQADLKKKKQHDKDAKLKARDKAIEKLEQENNALYASKKLIFERTHAKIIDESIFIHETANKVVIMTRDKMRTSYEHETVGVDKNGKTLHFIDLWFSDDDIRCYNDMDVYPNPDLCPERTYNLWRPFAIELLKDEKYEPDEEGKEFILNHFKLMCNNDIELYEYFKYWVAQMFQYPETKTVAFVFVGKQGSGKSTITKTLSKMMGCKKILETKKPSRDVTGEFNELMMDAFLVNISEAKIKDSKDGSSEIKGLITDEYLPINKKGFGKISVRSFHRFIYDSNNLNCVETSNDDRRFVIARVSDEKCGDKEYFKKLNDYIDDINVLRTLYDYLMSIPNMDKFNTLVKPVTEHQHLLVQLSRTIPELWLEDFCEANKDVETVVLTPQEIYDQFNEWCIKSNIEYQVDKRKLGVQLSLLKIDGGIVSNSNKRDKNLNIKVLKEYFGIEVCVI